MNAIKKLKSNNTMGTNYYIRIQTKSYHIGKKSSGYNFVFNWSDLVDLLFDSNIINTSKWSMIKNELNMYMNQKHSVTSISFNDIKEIILVHKNLIYTEFDEQVDIGEIYDYLVSIDRNLKPNDSSDSSLYINIYGYYGINQYFI